MTDGYFLDRPSQDQLVELLDQIPALTEDLTIALTRQDRIGTGGPRVRTGSDEQPLPIGIAAMEASDLLHDTLAAWVRLVCEQRHYPHPGNATLTLGRWLKRSIIALALTPGAEESLDEIQHAIRKARAAIDRPRDKVRDINPVEVYEAGSTLLTATQIERIAASLGHPNLTMRRVLRLKDAEKLEPVMQSREGDDLYRIADVIAAHLAHPTRQRKAA